VLADEAALLAPTAMRYTTTWAFLDPTGRLRRCAPILSPVAHRRSWRPPDAFRVAIFTQLSRFDRWFDAVTGRPAQCFCTSRPRKGVRVSDKQLHALDCGCMPRSEQVVVRKALIDERAEYPSGFPPRLKPA
jgi:hypothetical protein